MAVHSNNFPRFFAAIGVTFCCAQRLATVALTRCDDKGIINLVFLPRACRASSLWQATEWQSSVQKGIHFRDAGSHQLRGVVEAD